MGRRNSKLILRSPVPASRPRWAAVFSFLRSSYGSVYLLSLSYYRIHILGMYKDSCSLPNSTPIHPSFYGALTLFSCVAAIRSHLCQSVVSLTSNRHLRPTPLRLVCVVCVLSMIHAIVCHFVGCTANESVDRKLKGVEDCFHGIKKWRGREEECFHNLKIRQMPTDILALWNEVCHSYGARLRPRRDTSPRGRMPGQTKLYVKLN